MVAAHILGINKAVFYFVTQTVGAKKIIYAPTRIFLSCIEHIAPPAVCALFVRVKSTKAVAKSGGKQLRHLFPLLIGKAGVLPVGLRIF